MRPKTASGYAIDSRLIKKGDLFFALPGKKVDGHTFLNEAAQRGAVGAVVQKSYTGPDFGLTLTRVENVVEHLQQMAHHSLLSRKERIIAITGSMGKTTTKEFLAELLSVRYRVFRTPGNYNTQATLPLTLLNIKEEYDFLVLEMGMSERGHIAKLVQIAPPELSILTRIAPAGFAGSLEEIARAKAEIFSHPKTELGILSAQAAEFKTTLTTGSFPKLLYGSKGQWYWEGNRIREEGLLSPEIPLAFDATHLRENFLAAASTARILGLSWEEICSRAPLLAPFKRRFEKIVRQGITFIQDCYNANPDSMCAALYNLPRPKEGGKTVAILGRMPDLIEPELHHRKVGAAAAEKVDVLFSIGEEAKIYGQFFSANWEHFSDTSSIRKRLFEEAKEGDVVLIKGANSLKLWEILETEDATTTL